MTVRRLALALLLGATVASCARQAPPPGPAPRQPRAAPRPTEPALPAAEYVATAASIDLFEIRSAELALQRSASAAHRDFARMMIEAHRGTSAQLSFAGRRLNLLPSSTLLPEHQTMLNELNFTANFDGVYRRQQTTIHETALTLHSAYAARGDSPTLRPVAAAAVPIVRRHLDMLRRMR